MRTKREKVDSGFYYECAGCERVKLYNGKEDNGTRYGSSDYEGTEPHDPDFFCPTCSRREYREIKKNLLALIAKGATKTYKSWWQLPDFYSRAMHDTGWISEGHDLVYKPQ